MLLDFFSFPFNFHFFLHVWLQQVGFQVMGICDTKFCAPVRCFETTQGSAIIYYLVGLICCISLEKGAENAEITCWTSRYGQYPTTAYLFISLLINTTNFPCEPINQLWAVSNNSISFDIFVDQCLPFHVSLPLSTCQGS